MQKSVKTKLTDRERNRLYAMRDVLARGIEGHMAEFHNIPYLFDDAMMCFCGIIDSPSHRGTAMAQETALLFFQHGYCIRLLPSGDGYSVDVSRRFAERNAKI